MAKPPARDTHCGSAGKPAILPQVVSRCAKLKDQSVLIQNKGLTFGNTSFSETRCPAGELLLTASTTQQKQLCVVSLFEHGGRA